MKKIVERDNIIIKQVICNNRFYINNVNFDEILALE